VAEAAGLHVAVLCIGEAGATPDDGLVVERLRSAGHAIVARASVDNFVPVVRRQLAAWVADANIDIVVAIGGGDDNVASSALAPLVTQQLPGFADVFRMLVFQTLGSAAVLANAEAARCTAKVVFLLPAMADGVRLALDKLIIPQLDARTEPYNVARLLPRRDDKPSTIPSATKPGADHPSSPTAPPRTASARTTPPPFRRTPPAGVPADAKATEVVKPAELADASKATPDKPKPEDSGKLVVDIEAIGGVVEAEDSGKLREVRTEPATPQPAAPQPAAPPQPAPLQPAPPILPQSAAPLPIVRPPYDSMDPDRTERVFVIKPRQSQPRMAMFGAPRSQIHPVAKGLAVLAALALAGTAAIVVWSRVGLGTKRVSASNPTPGDLQASQPPPPPLLQQPAAQPPAAAAPSVDPLAGSAAAAPPPTSEIDVDPPTSAPMQAPPAPTPPGPASQPAHPHVAAAPPAPPTHAVDPAAQPPTPPTQPAAPAATQPQPAADGCDEVACVMDQYARPCCEAFRPKAASAHPGVPDQLDRTAAREAIDTMKPVVIACGERFKVKGQVRIALVVAPDGHVTSSTVAASPDEGLGACVAEALRRVQFKQTSNGAHFTYPYQF
jgi:molybdenum cofactor biosynthesis protein B